MYWQLSCLPPHDSFCSPLYKPWDPMDPIVPWWFWHVCCIPLVFSFIFCIFLIPGWSFPVQSKGKGVFFKNVLKTNFFKDFPVHTIALLLYYVQKFVWWEIILHQSGGDISKLYPFKRIAIWILPVLSDLNDALLHSLSVYPHILYLGIIETLTNAHYKWGRWCLIGFRYHIFQVLSDRTIDIMEYIN